jgi:hypothetical protein
MKRVFVRWPSLLIAGVSLTLLRFCALLFSAYRLGPLLVTFSAAAPRERPQRHAAQVVALALRAGVSAVVLVVVMGSVGGLSRQVSFACQLGLLLGAFGVQQAIGSAHSERGGEIQTLMALGAPRRQVFSLLIVEAFVVAIVSGAIAALLGALFAHIGLLAGGQLERQLVPIGSLWLAMFGLLLIANLIPAWRAVRVSLAHCMAGVPPAPPQTEGRGARIAQLVGLLALAAASFDFGKSIDGDALAMLWPLLSCQVGVALLLPSPAGPADPRGGMRASAHWLKRTVRLQEETTGDETRRSASRRNLHPGAWAPRPPSSM